MSYIGNVPTTAAFPFDQFSGTGAATSFTLTYAPAGTTSILVAISGVMQNPNLYSVIGTTLSFSPAPPAGTNNISVLYLGLPVIGSSSPGNTAFLSATDLTATAGQTVFASAGSYTPGFVVVYRNGARLGAADYTATNGTTITLANAATAGDLVTIEYYTLTSLVNALPLTGGTVTGTVTFNSAITGAAATFSGIVAANGGGIKFPATQSASSDANTLDDYEEGTWTPTNIGGSLVVVGAFTSSGTYTKIGKVVTVAGTLNGATSVTISGGGNVVCGGLPFSAAAATLCAGSAVNAAATATASLYANATTNVGSVTAMTATASIFFSITYFV